FFFDTLKNLAGKVIGALT
nr:Chain A, L-Phenylseptin peptide [Boana punctata]